ncbi:MAG: sensor histidine kinase, partial [Proteobacteria bacterium]|nr:sensor histidine kinase [Pseudomonadota bacterium]
DQMTQVFLNLVVNALEAMPQGGRLEVSAGQDGGFLEVRVGDTGAGIAPADLTRLFDPFFSTKKKGSGLGLAIAQRIVDNHGGTIRAESEPDKGTTFVVRLPLDGPVAAAAQPLEEK